MSSRFNDFALELLQDMGADIRYERLNNIDRRRLTAAYLRENPEAMADIATAFVCNRMSDAIASLLEQPTRHDAIANNDCIEFAGDVWEFLWPNADLADQVEAAFEHVARQRGAA